MKRQSKVIRSGSYILPNLLTTFNLICGMIAILLALENYTSGITAQTREYSTSAWLLLAAMVFDFLDGKVARWTNTVSDFGVKIDSFTDFVSFGIAPMVLAYAALLKPVPFILSGLVGFAYLGAGAWRLARFNCETQTSPSQYFFTGLPIPAASAFVATVVLLSGGHHPVMHRFLLQSINNLPPRILGILAAFLMVALAVLMVSRIPFPAFKKVNQNNLIILGGVAGFFCVLSLVLPWENIVFLIMMLYILIGLFQYFLNRVLKMHQEAAVHK